MHTANTTIGTSDDVYFGTDTVGLAAGTVTGPGTAQGLFNMTFGSASGAVNLSGGKLNLKFRRQHRSRSTMLRTPYTKTILQGAGGKLTKIRQRQANHRREH